MATSEAVRRHFRACNLCEAICGIEVVLQGESIRTIRGDKDDPLGRGHLCPKALALQDIHEDPDRLRHPLRRTPSGWERIGWDEAFDEAASRLKDVQRVHGNNAVGVYLGNPSVHNYGSMLFGVPLLKALAPETVSRQPRWISYRTTWPRRCCSGTRCYSRCPMWIGRISSSLWEPTRSYRTAA